jgi:hypothetical protein
MTITGNVKFFGINQIDENTTPTFTSANTALLDFLFDNDRLTRLTSIGSNDATPEVWVLDFGSSKTFDRIFIDNHNIKSGKLEYWNGVAYVDFSSAIAWSANATVTHYYEFNSVTTTKIRLTMNTTMTVNDQKRVGSLIAFSEIGSVLVNPSKLTPIWPERSVNHRGSKNGSIYVIFGRKYKATIQFSDASITDIVLFETLKNYATSFYIYPCGGSGQVELGFRLQDIFFVNYTNEFNPDLNGNLYGIGQTLTMIVEEV